MKELTLEMSDGIKIYATVREPKQKAVGHIHLLHGMAEHSGRYDRAANYFVDRGYLVTAHDHRGHGRTVEMNGQRGYFTEENGFHRVVEDAYEVIGHMKNEHPTNRFILFGHSMGSFIARRFIQVYGEMVDQTILSGTGDDAGVARLAGQGLGHFLGRKLGFDQPNAILNDLVFGRFNRGVKKPLTKFDWISANREYVISYFTDEYCGFVPTTQFFLDLFDGLGVIHDTREIEKIPKEMPILLFSGTDDPVGNYGKALWKVAKQYDDAQLKNVTVLLFENGRHELIGDSKRKEVIQAVEEWIEKNV